jgi:hypothetical protein
MAHYGSPGLGGEFRDRHGFPEEDARVRAARYLGAKSWRPGSETP